MDQRSGPKGLYTTYDWIKGDLRDASDAWSDWITYFEETYRVLQGWIDIYRLLSFLVALMAILWAWTEMSTEASDDAASSQAPSPASSPGSTPPVSPRSGPDPTAAALTQVAEAMNRQQEMLGRMLSQQESPRQQLIDHADDRSAMTILQAVGGSPAAQGTEAANKAALDAMFQRMDTFTKILEVDRQGRSGADGGAGGNSWDFVVASAAAGVAGSSLGGTVVPVADAMKFLLKNAERPQETFKEVLAEYSEVDSVVWEQNFPVGYRERRAPAFFAEVYGTGESVRKWAKRFINDRQLGDCARARELTPTMAAADMLLLKDRPPGAINSLAVEKLAKKGLGIFKAFRLCQSKGDWDKPSTAKNWKSKVDEELWRRTDPAVAGFDEMEFVNRAAEDEIRTEMDREAAIAKARTKLAEAKGDSRLLVGF